MLKASTALDLLSGDIGALVFTHKEASLDDVGRNYLKPREISMLSSAIPKSVGLVVLQTCNRIEVYFHGDYQSTVDLLVEELRKLGKSVDERWKRLRGWEAVHHLFRVAAGLEALSVGENEVLGQVRDAYRQWRRRGRVDQRLSELFDRALRVGRRVRAETSLSKGKTGVYSLAIAYASQRVDLDSSRVAVVGAGDVCSKIVKMLYDMGVCDVTVLNRTTSRAKRLAKNYGYRFSPLVFGELSGYDVVFAAIYSLRQVEVSGPRVVVDLSVPPVFIGQNVVYLEELREVASKNAEAKAAEVKRAEDIIREEEDKLARQLQRHLADSYISKIMGRIESIRAEEVRRALRVLQNRGVDTNVSAEVLDALTHSIINKTFYRVLEDIRLLTYQGDMEHVEYLLSLFAGDKA